MLPSPLLHDALPICNVVKGTVTARSRGWFDLDHEWFEENFMTHEPYLYEKLYQTKPNGDDTKTYQLFAVPIGNEKILD